MHKCLSVAKQCDEPPEFADHRTPAFPASSKKKGPAGAKSDSSHIAPGPFYLARPAGKSADDALPSVDPGLDPATD